MEWQKVGTHPEKELILFTDGRRVVSGWFDPHSRQWPWIFNDMVDYYVTGCCDMEEDDLVKMNAFGSDRVTHWMPLPEPPKAD